VSAVPARGEVWWCELAEIGRRPAVVLVERLGRLTDARLREICRALAVAVDCQS
jgi:mRNA-degrading endonuclease toxin of MazEF toxin-antitoxin module